MNDFFLCIDPGPKYSGIAVFENGIITLANKSISLDILNTDLGDLKHKIVLIEKIEPRGSIVGHSTIDTAVMCGRFFQEFRRRQANVFFIERRQVLSTLGCKKDADIIKLLRPMVKTKEGIKLKADAWQAAALYYTYHHE